MAAATETATAVPTDPGATASKAENITMGAEPGNETANETSTDPDPKSETNAPDVTTGTATQTTVEVATAKTVATDAATSTDTEAEADGIGMTEPRTGTCVAATDAETCPTAETATASDSEPAREATAATAVESDKAESVELTPMAAQADKTETEPEMESEPTETALPTTDAEAVQTVTVVTEAEAERGPVIAAKPEMETVSTVATAEPEAPSPTANGVVMAKKEETKAEEVPAIAATSVLETEMDIGTDPAAKELTEILTEAEPLPPHSPKPEAEEVPTIAAKPDVEMNTSVATAENETEPPTAHENFTAKTGETEVTAIAVQPEATTKTETESPTSNDVIMAENEEANAEQVLAVAAKPAVEAVTMDATTETGLELPTAHYVIMAKSADTEAEDVLTRVTTPVVEAVTTVAMTKTEPESATVKDIIMAENETIEPDPASTSPFQYAGPCPPPTHMLLQNKESRLQWLKKARESVSYRLVAHANLREVERMVAGTNENPKNHRQSTTRRRRKDKSMAKNKNAVVAVDEEKRDVSASSIKRQPDPSGHTTADSNYYYAHCAHPFRHLMDSLVQQAKGNPMPAVVMPPPPDAPCTPEPTEIDDVSVTTADSNIGTDRTENDAAINKTSTPPPVVAETMCYDDNASFTYVGIETLLDHDDEYENFSDDFSMSKVLFPDDESPNDISKESSHSHSFGDLLQHTWSTPSGKQGGNSNAPNNNNSTALEQEVNHLVDSVLKGLDQASKDVAIKSGKSLQYLRKSIGNADSVVCLDDTNFTSPDEAGAVLYAAVIRDDHDILDTSLVDLDDTSHQGLLVKRQPNNYTKNTYFGDTSPVNGALTAVSNMVEGLSYSAQCKCPDISPGGVMARGIKPPATTMVWGGDKSSSSDAASESVECTLETYVKAVRVVTPVHNKAEAPAKRRHPGEKRDPPPSLLVSPDQVTDSRIFRHHHSNGNIDENDLGDQDSLVRVASV